MTISPSLIELEGKSFDSLERKIFEIRCARFGCNMLFTKLFVITDVAETIRERMEKDGLRISDLIPGINIKIGLETKCRRCKGMDYKLEVI